MTTPTREQVVQLFEDAGVSAGWKPGFGNDRVLDYLSHFATLARADLEAELESLRKDAERYLFITRHAYEITGHNLAWQTDACGIGVRDETLDAVVDSAIAAAPKEK